MSDSTETLAEQATRYPVVTRAEAAALVAAHAALEAIKDRATSQTWHASAPNAAYAARLAERADVARYAIRAALICAKVYFESVQADEALERAMAS